MEDGRSQLFWHRELELVPERGPAELREKAGTQIGRPGKEENTLQSEQTVAEMANEVLLRQAKSRADRNGEPIEAAMGAVVGTEAGKQLRELRDGPYAEEGVEEWQVGLARERARERAADIGGGGRFGEVPRHPTHG
jgi:hypothetical protein